MVRRRVRLEFTSGRRAGARGCVSRRTHRAPARGRVCVCVLCACVCACWGGVSSRPPNALAEYVCSEYGGECSAPAGRRRGCAPAATARADRRDRPLRSAPPRALCAEATPWPAPMRDTNARCVRRSSARGCLACWRRDSSWLHEQDSRVSESALTLVASVGGERPGAGGRLRGGSSGGIPFARRHTRTKSAGQSRRDFIDGFLIVFFEARIRSAAL